METCKSNILPCNEAFLGPDALNDLLLASFLGKKEIGCICDKNL